MNDIAGQAVKKGAAHSKFLTSSEAASVRRAYQNRGDVTVSFEGGFIDAERVAAVFVNAEWGKYQREDIISALAITCRRQDRLSHRDILGAALGLGIERAVLGDIYIGEPSYLICLKDIAGFILDGLKQAGRVSLTVEMMPLSGLPSISYKLKEHTDTVASLRLDAVVASMFNLSRGVSAEYIQQGRVQLAHSLCEDISKTVSINDVISIRGLGRGKLLELGGQSKKGRVWIKFGIYV
jgi:RNA-binding protein YlmH